MWLYVAICGYMRLYIVKGVIMSVVICGYMRLYVVMDVVICGYILFRV